MKGPAGFAPRARQTQWCVPAVPTKMNLALIDPFQLAQDYPDALTNDLRKYRV
jgi:hypothetical protein